MKQIDSIAGKCYIATAPNGGTVTDEAGRTLATVEAGEQKAVWGTDGKLYLSDDDGKLVLATFNYALAALGLLGEGDKLPAGYTRLEFLEGSGTQYINTRVTANETSEALCTFERTTAESKTVYAAVSGGAFGMFVWGAALNALRFDWYSSQRTYSNVYPGGMVTTIQTPKGATLNGKQIVSAFPEGAFTTGVILLLSHSTSETTFRANNVRLAHWRLRNGGVTVRDMLPALDPTGGPCMFDLVSRTAFYNDNAGTGAFIAGFTLAQAAQLGRKLPSEGGELTVSLPEGYDSNEAVVNSLALAADKGWVLTVQTYAAETAAATFALRRVWVRRVEAEHGGYVAADGSRWQVDWCVDVVGADPQELGYERFRSVDAATEYWGLVPYVDPNAEELSTDE